MSVQIDSHVKLPKPKGKRIVEDARRKVFRAYAAAHETLYGSKPDSYTMTDAGYMYIWRGQIKTAVGTLTRIKQLTRMMRDRISDRA